MASLFMRFPGGKALTLSYDDGVEQDVRLIDIMNKFGLKGTFNLNSGEYAEEGTVFESGRVHRRMTMERVSEVYKKSGQEVAVHGLTHPFLEQLPKNVCVREICQDRANLEEQFGSIIRGMAYPFGTYNDEVVEILRENGIAYARTVCSSNEFSIPTDWLRLRPTCHHDDPKLMDHAEKFVNEKLSGAPWMFYLWGHSYEFEAKDNWEVIEKFAEMTGNRNDIWYATNIEIYDYVKAYEQLQFSMEMTRVYNPTAQTLYFEYNGVQYEVAAGEHKSMQL